MFEKLQDRLSRVMKDLRGQGKIRESNITDALEEVRKSLLEADVHYRVVQSVVDSVRQKALGQRVLDEVEPGQQFIKFVYDEIVRILGAKEAQLPEGDATKPIRIMMVGLQGTGKTTTAAKLGVFLKNEKRKQALLVPADTTRPAAREQLKTLGSSQGVQVFDSAKKQAVDVCVDASKAVEDRSINASYVIYDTAGRLAIDEALMAELSEIKQKIKPHLILYVLDAMAGQDAVKTAKAFHDQLNIDGVILTKIDGDSRGGAILSVSEVVGKPIYFAGAGEAPSALEVFFPDRMASRILGMGDIVTLVEKAQKVMDEDQARKLSEKLRKNQFTLEDFLDQMKSIQKMGSFKDIIGLIPGGAKLNDLANSGLPEKEMKRIEAMIFSMTPEERRNHLIIDGSRRKRIAQGSGMSVADVNRFLNQFVQAKKMMTRLGQIGMKGARRGGFF